MCGGKEARAAWSVTLANVGSSDAEGERERAGRRQRCARWAALADGRAGWVTGGLAGCHAAHCTHAVPGGRGWATGDGRRAGQAGHGTGGGG